MNISLPKMLELMASDFRLANSVVLVQTILRSTSMATSPAPITPGSMTATPVATVGVNRDTNCGTMSMCTF